MPPTIFFSLGDVFSGGDESGTLWSPCSRAGQAPLVPGHQTERDPGCLLGETIGGELEGELGQYGACLLKVMLKVEGAKLKFQLRLVSCQNSFWSCDIKHLRPMKEIESAGLGHGMHGLVMKSRVRGESQVSG